MLMFRLFFNINTLTQPYFRTIYDVFISKKSCYFSHSLGMKKIELEIIALSHSVTQSHSFAVVLGEVGGTRRLPIVIGGFEAQAIAVALDNMKPSRPLTHDLMKTICDTFEIELEYVHITKLLDGVFYSNLVSRRIRALWSEFTAFAEELKAAEESVKKEGGEAEASAAAAEQLRLKRRRVLEVEQEAGRMGGDTGRRIVYDEAAIEKLLDR